MPCFWSASIRPCVLSPPWGETLPHLCLPGLRVVFLEGLAAFVASLAASGLGVVIVDLKHSFYDPTRLESSLVGMTSKVDKVVTAARESGVPLGTLCGGEVAKRLAQGFRFLSLGSDGGVSGSVQEAVKTGRAWKASR